MAKIARSNSTLLLLTLSLLLLVLLNFVFTDTTAQASQAIKDRDYQLITARIQGGGEALYVVDNRSGRIAVFSYDLATRSLQTRALGQVADAFPAK